MSWAQIHIHTLGPTILLKDGTTLPSPLVSLLRPSLPTFRPSTHFFFAVSITSRCFPVSLLQLAFSASPSICSQMDSDSKGKRRSTPKRKDSTTETTANQDTLALARRPRDPSDDRERYNF